MNIPTDLNKALSKDSAVKALWKDLTPIAQRDFVSWIESAKKPETRKARIERTPDMLLKGKRRPCCYAVVPTGIYRALETNSKAKTQWRSLTPDERRDFVAWIDAEKGTDRIKKALTVLAAGKRHP